MNKDALYSYIWHNNVTNVGGTPHKESSKLHITMQSGLSRDYTTTVNLEFIEVVQVGQVVGTSSPSHIVTILLYP